MTKISKLRIQCEYEGDKLVLESYFYFLAMTLFSQDFKAYELTSTMPMISFYVYF